MRVLITGSRDWHDIQLIHDALSMLELPLPVTLVSGACPTGADAICEEAAEELGWNIERHPADWKRHGRRAGYVRNAEMVDLGADLCLAFIKNRSRGASMTAELARKAGMRLIIFEATT